MAHYNQAQEIRHAIEQDDLNFLKLHLNKHNVNIEVKFLGYNFTPLMYAARLGRGRIIEFLLENHLKDLKLELVDLYGQNALLNSIYSLDVFTIKLVSKYLKADSKDYFDNNCLHIASELGNLEIVRMCVEEIGVKYEKNFYGCTPLHLAMSREVMEYLILNGAEVDDADEQGWTPLHYAVYENNEEIVRVLIRSGASIKIFDKTGVTAFELGFLRDPSSAIIQLLKLEMEKYIKEHMKTNINLIEKAKEEPKEEPIANGSILETVSENLSIELSNQHNDNDINDNEDAMSIDLSVDIKGSTIITNENPLDIQEANSIVVSEEESQIPSKPSEENKSVLQKHSSIDSIQSNISPEVKDLISVMLNQKFSVHLEELGVETISINELQMREVLGTGGYGKVFRGYFRDTEVAIKVVNSDKIDDIIIKNFIKEIQSLIKIRHRRFLQILGICIEGPLCIVTELAKGGNLADALLKGNFDFNEKLRIALQIAEGMNYIHNKKPPIIHRDLKPQNILLDEFKQIKIADLGLSRTVAQIKDPNTTEKTNICAGTVRYMAPELYDEHPDCSRKTDVWAFGCVLYQIITGLQPWNGIDVVGVQRRLVLKNQFPIGDIEPKNISDLIMICCHIDPEIRPSFRDIRLKLQEILGFQASLPS